MTGMILGIVLIALLVLFVVASCKVASWVDQEMEGGFEKWKSERKS